MISRKRYGLSINLSRTYLEYKSTLLAYMKPLAHLKKILRCVQSHTERTLYAILSYCGAVDLLQLLFSSPGFVFRGNGSQREQGCSLHSAAFCNLMNDKKKPFSLVRRAG